MADKSEGESADKSEGESADKSEGESADKSEGKSDKTKKKSSKGRCVYMYRPVARPFERGVHM